MMKDISFNAIISLVDIFISLLLIPVIKLVFDLKVSLEKDKILIERILDDIEELREELKEVRDESQTHRN